MTLSFTKQVLEGVQVALESSRDLLDWKEEVVLEGSKAGASTGFAVAISESSVEPSVAGILRVELLS